MCAQQYAPTHLPLANSSQNTGHRRGGEWWPVLFTKLLINWLKQILRSWVNRKCRLASASDLEKPGGYSCLRLKFLS